MISVPPRVPPSSWKPQQILRCSWLCGALPPTGSGTPVIQRPGNSSWHHWVSREKSLPTVKAPFLLSDKGGREALRPELSPAPDINRTPGLWLGFYTEGNAPSISVERLREEGQRRKGRSGGNTRLPSAPAWGWKSSLPSSSSLASLSSALTQAARVSSPCFPPPCLAKQEAEASDVPVASPDAPLRNRVHHASPSRALAPAPRGVDAASERLAPPARAPPSAP